MKRVLALLLAAFIAAALSSCMIKIEKKPTDPTVIEISTEEETQYRTVETVAAKSPAGLKAVASRYGYNALPLDSEKKLYDELLGIYLDISPEKDEESDLYPMPQVEINASLSEAEVRTVIKAIYADNPDHFWTSGTIGYYSDYETTIVRLYSRYSPDEVDKMQKEIRDALDDFKSGIAKGMTEYELELYTHDFILERSEYDKDVDPDNADNNDPDIYTVYGPLVERIGVCEGYARALQLMLNSVGIDCVCVSGVGNTELHMWNAVKLGDEWYLVDSTWDDREEIWYRYGYFNLTDEQMSEDHTPSPMFDELSDDEINGIIGSINCDVMNMFIPECTDSKMGYYYRNAPRLIDPASGDDIKEALLKAALNEEDAFTFYIDDELSFYDTLDELFNNLPQYFFDYIDEIDGKLPDYSLDKTNISYFYVEKNRIAVVDLSYL